MSFNIAIDGPAGAGKSTIARRAAAEMGFIYVDTGALYRSVAYYCITKGADVKDREKIAALLPEISPELRFIDGVQHVFVNGEDVSGNIRTPEVSLGASSVSAYPEVRAFLFDLQRKIAAENNVIMDGRDIGTNVFRDAEYKIFLTASAKERAERRFEELTAKGQKVDFDEVLRDIEKRDHDDMTRALNPLRKAEDAVEIDTTGLSIDEVIERVLKEIT